MSSLKRDSVLVNAKRNVGKALKFDTSGSASDAYVQYLQSVQHIVGDLLFATTQPGYDRSVDPKLIKLAQQCLDRAGELILNVSGDESNLGIRDCISLPFEATTPTQTQSNPLVSPVSQAPLFNSHAKEQKPQIRPRSNSSGSGQSTTTNNLPSVPKDRPRDPTPMEVAMQQNQKLVQAYRARMAKLGKQEASNLSLTLQRRLAENVALAKKREAALEKRLQERHKRLLQEATERLQYTTGMSKNEQERRQMYACVREYEQDTKWMLPLKKKLEESPDSENLQSELIKEVLGASKHPLTIYIGKHQYAVYDKIRPLLDKFRQRMFPQQSARSCLTPASTSFGDTSSRSVSETVATPLSDPGKEDEFDYLFESDDHGACGDIGKVPGNVVTPPVFCEESRGENNNCKDKKIRINKRPSDLDIPEQSSSIPEQTRSDSTGTCLTPLDALEQEALQRHIENIVQDIHDYLEKIQTMFIVAYEQLDTVTGRELIYGCLEPMFYKPIWGYILELFRLMQYEKESKFGKSLETFSTSGPEEFKVSERFFLKDSADNDTNVKDSSGSEPYEKAIFELRSLRSFESPLSKLECIVRVSRLICTCVEEWYSSRNTPVPSIGADDLVPILCYVIAKANTKQLIAECQAMEELMHESYLMGEEGYCLASIQTALGYLASLA